MVENVLASIHTIESRIPTICFDIFTDLKNYIANCLSLNLALDESTDIQDNLSWPYLFIMLQRI